MTAVTVSLQQRRLLLLLLLLPSLLQVSWAQQQQQPPPSWSNATNSTINTTTQEEQEIPIHSNHNDHNQYWTFPTNITLRAGVLHAPPFATLDYQHREDGSAHIIYGGLQIDLLRHLVQYALQDGIVLTVDLSPSPPSYGPAFDLVALDCDKVANLTDTSNYPNASHDCHAFDLIVGNYYATPERSLRAELSPAWLRSTITTVKLAPNDTTTTTTTTPSPPPSEITTLQQATNANFTVCLKSGTFYAGIVTSAYPTTSIHWCPGTQECIQQLQHHTCILYVDDELQLRYQEAQDATLQVTRESFHTQYIVWPISYTSVSRPVRKLLETYIRQAIADAVLDDLYGQYFQTATCPIGTAGEQCDLPCDPVHGQADKLGQCVCVSTKWTGDDCSIEVPENTNSIPASTMGVAYAMLGINVITIVVCAIWLFLHRRATQVVVSQPFFLCLVLLGCLISSSTIIALGRYDDGYGPVHACMAIPWLYSVGFCVTFGTLFAKIRRVYLIFKSSMGLKRTMVSVRETLVIIGAVLLVDVVILTIWTIVDPLQWERTTISADQFGAPLESEGYCSSEYWGAFMGALALLHFVLLLVACYLCYVSRDIPTRFSEGKYLSVAMVSNLQIFVVGIPVLFIIGGQPATSFFVRSVMIWMNDFVVVTLIFGNLIYSVHFQHAGNEAHAKQAVSQALTKYSQSHRERSSRRSMLQQNSEASRIHNNSDMSQQYSLGNSSHHHRRSQSMDGSGLTTSRRSVDDPEFNASGSNQQSFSGDDAAQVFAGLNDMPSTGDSISDLSSLRRKKSAGNSHASNVTFDLPPENQGSSSANRCALCNTVLVKATDKSSPGRELGRLVETSCLTDDSNESISEKKAPIESSTHGDVATRRGTTSIRRAAQKLKDFLPQKSSLDSISEKTDGSPSFLNGSLSRFMKQGDVCSSGADEEADAVADVDIAPFDDPEKADSDDNGNENSTEPKVASRGNTFSQATDVRDLVFYE